MVAVKLFFVLVFISVTPHFVTRPEDQKVIFGRNATLTCTATGFPTPTLSWLFNVSK